MAPDVRCDPDGLLSLSAACEEHALNVCCNDQPALPQLVHQSTIAAVSGLYETTSTAADVLATRIRSTAAALAVAARRYAQTDDVSAAALAESMPVEVQ